MRTNTIFRLAVILGLGSVASHVSAVPNTPTPKDAIISNIHDARKLAGPYRRLPRSVIPRRENEVAQKEADVVPDALDSPVPRPAEPQPPSARPTEPQAPSLSSTSADPKADAHESRSLRVRVHRGTELVYDPIDSAYSEVSTTPWWARGEEGLSWRRDEVTGELVPQSQGAAARMEALHRVGI
ncbi:hypothetical protein FB451DRAFT_477380 [Mycena latifolia]|nr:hypothetical protein FB451DRAFT_477380 [Mycena latifolia]